MAKWSICTRCGFVGYPKKLWKGSFWLELVLWLCFLLPGLIYSIWRLTSKYDGCPACKNASMIPVDTPMGKNLVSAQKHSQTASATGLCPFCGSPRQEGHYCPGCGKPLPALTTAEPVPQPVTTVERTIEPTGPNRRNIFARNAFVFSVVIIGGIVLLMLTIVESRVKTPPPTPKSQVVEAAGVGTTAERNYIGAALSYLDTANKLGRSVAEVAVGLSNGSAGLSNMRQALSRAKFVENAGYWGDYHSRIQGKVPARFAVIARNIDETHRLFQDAMQEGLAYWSDPNAAHIIRGGRKLNHCILLMNSTIVRVGQGMNQLNAKKVLK